MEHMIRQYRESLGLTHEEFMDLGRVRSGDKNEPFCMTVLALKTASRSNGVSSIHGQVSRQMWNGLWPDSPPQHVPIGHITNGINVLGWRFSSDRMVIDYAIHSYLPAAGISTCQMDAPFV